VKFYVAEVEALRKKERQGETGCKFWAGVNHQLCWHLQCFFKFWGEILLNFDLKNMILIYTKDFPWKNWPKFARFWKKKLSKSPDFYFIFFPYFHI
jgi:hypothetical protein